MKKDCEVKESNQKLKGLTDDVPVSTILFYLAVIVTILSLLVGGVAITYYGIYWVSVNLAASPPWAITMFVIWYLTSNGYELKKSAINTENQKTPLSNEAKEYLSARAKVVGNKIISKD